MSNEIKEILDEMKFMQESKVKFYSLDIYQSKLLLDCITNLQEELKSANESITWWTNRFKALQQENERLKEQNNDLRRIYKNTYNRLFQNGNDELARYFQAQIDDCSTFYVEPIIDFAKEWKDYKSRNEEAREMIRFIVYNSERLLTITELNKVYNILGGDDNESKRNV